MIIEHTTPPTTAIFLLVLLPPKKKLTIYFISNLICLIYPANRKQQPIPKTTDPELVFRSVEQDKTKDIK